MAGNSFGRLFRITTAGESHGPANVVIIDGVPPGLELDVSDLQPDLDRRRPGQSAITTQRKEPDAARILSGVFEGRTTGTSIAILIENADQRSRDYSEIQDKYRPGHADYTFDAKYGFRDYRGGGRSSARETAARVAAGAVARKLLRLRFGVEILGFVTQVGDVEARIDDPAAVTFDAVEATPVRCPDHEAASRMIELIEKVRAERDSIGGVAQVVARGLPPGWGEPVFDKLKADLGKAILSLPAVLGVEYGAGFRVASLRGSQNNDLFLADDAPDDPPAAEGQAPSAVDSEAADPTDSPLGRTRRTGSNRHGGMLGGISSGMPLILRAAIKPTSSIPQDLPTVTRTGEAATIATRGRHDPCLLPRFIPMAEAMVALTLADHALRHTAMLAASPAIASETPQPR